MRPRHPAQVFRDRLAGRLDLPPAGQLDGATVAYVAVLLALANYADARLLASPGRVELARQLALSEAAVKRAFGWAITAGLIERVRVGNKHGASVYRLIVPTASQGVSSDPLAAFLGGQKHRPRGSAVTPLLEELGDAGHEAADAPDDPWKPWPTTEEGDQP